MKIIILFSFIVLLSSCYTTQYIPDRLVSTKISEIHCPKPPDSIPTFFTYVNGEKIDFEYTSIALISANNGNSGNSNPLFNLKMNAVEQCADGIINLNQNVSNGNYTTTYHHHNDHRNSHDDVTNNSFQVINYNALAVKLKDSMDRYRLNNDTSFIYNHKMLKLNPPIQSENEGGGASGILLFLALIGAIAEVYLELR